MTFQEDILASLSVTEADAIKNIISRKPFIYYGVITKVEGEGIVKVVPSVIGREEDYFEIDCVLATVASQSVAVRIVPHVGDKVMVFSPMNYSNKMFLKKNNGTLLAKNSRGYSIFTGIAVLWNQVQKEDHHNYIVVDSGTVEVHLAYDEEEGANKAVVTIDSDGAFTYSNPNTTLSIGADGNISVTTAGKYSLSNGDTDLLSVFTELINVLKTFKTVGSPSTQSTSPDTATALANWQSEQAEKLLATPSSEESE